MCVFKTPVHIWPLRWYAKVHLLCIWWTVEDLRSMQVIFIDHNEFYGQHQICVACSDAQENEAAKSALLLEAASEAPRWFCKAGIGCWRLSHGYIKISHADNQQVTWTWQQQRLLCSCWGYSHGMEGLDSQHQFTSFCRALRWRSVKLFFGCWTSVGSVLGGSVILGPLKYVVMTWMRWKLCRCFWKHRISTPSMVFCQTVQVLDFDKVNALCAVNTKKCRWTY